MATSYDLTCTICTTQFTASRRRKYCAKKCERQGSPNRCTQTGCTKPVRARLLCVTHYNVTYHPGSQKLWPGDIAAKRKRDLIHHKRRRAAQRGVHADRVDRDLVGERDRWLCFCGERVDRAIAYPDPMSPSLDHVVPLAEDGPHTYANTRIAHLTCNLTRGARGGGEQLALL